MSTLKARFTDFIHELQDSICTAIEHEDGKATFQEDRWTRDGLGGGKTRVIAGGDVFEKGGVNTSVVEGKLPEVMQKHFGVSDANFFACGISLVIHPYNPMVPTVHANWRMFEMYDADGGLKDAWFGGGADLTPYYLWEEDCVHFHRVMKNACDATDPKYYPMYKKECDAYFRNHHRDECRGIGGLFYDYLRAEDGRDREYWFDFTTKVGRSFNDAYVPIVARRKHENFSDAHKYWQEIRRGRYAEFNLIHDRGTLFGLKTKGRIESILMSLPPTVRWDYDYQPEAGSREAELNEVLRNPKDWLS